MNGARWTARILSSVTTLIWGIIFIPQLFTNYYDEAGAFSPSAGALAVFIFFIIILAGTIIGWWSEKWGGVVLIAGYLANAVGGYILAIPNMGFIPVIIFIPFLICGILYILFWEKNRTLVSRNDESSAS